MSTDLHVLGWEASPVQCGRAILYLCVAKHNDFLHAQCILKICHKCLKHLNRTVVLIGKKSLQFNRSLTNRKVLPPTTKHQTEALLLPFLLTCFLMSLFISYISSFSFSFSSLFHPPHNPSSPFLGV